MRRQLFIGGAILCLACALAQPTCVESATISPVINNGVDALKASYAIGRDFEGHERVSYLVRLTRNSASIAPELTEKWCDELFMLASKSPLEWDRVANQKNAAVSLAKIAPKHAMELLSKVDKNPQHSPVDDFPEDVRADAAAHIFPEFWKKYGESGLADLERQAKVIGDSGEFPYRGMAFVVDGLVGLNRDDAKARASAIFTEGLGYYKRYSKFRDEEQEFLILLQSGRHVATDDSYREALELFLQHVKGPEKEGAFAADVSTPHGIIEVHGQNRFLLLQAFPLLYSFDPTWGQTLAATDPELKQAEDGVEALGAAVIYDNLSQSEVNRKHRQMLETALVPRISDLQESNPQAAMQQAEALRTPSVRIIAYTAVLPGLVRSDPVAARELYAQQLRELRGIPEPPNMPIAPCDQQPAERLRILVAAARSAYYVEDMAQFTAFSNQILDTGTFLFEKDLKCPRADAHTGYREMTDIVEFAAAHNLSWIVEKAQRVENPFLRAHLLIFIAKGLDEAQRQRGIPGR